MERYRVIAAVLLITTPFFFLFSQETATLQGGEVVKAGETIHFTLTLDRAPNFEPGSLQFRIASLDNSVSSIGWGVPIIKGVKSYTTSVQLPMDAPGRIWQVTVSFSGGMKTSSINTPKVIFRVIANEGLVIPSRAEVTINPSQIQLLRREAGHLQERIQSLKATIAKVDSEGAGNKVRSAIRLNLSESARDLKTTQKEFQELATVVAQNEISRTFFDDLAISYRDALSHVDERKGDLITAQTVNAVYLIQGPVKSTEYPLVAHAALRAFEQNELA